MPNGYWDRILHVDLTARTTWTESLGDAWWRRNLGGRAMIAHYLLSGVPVGADPGAAVQQQQRLAVAADFDMHLKAVDVDDHGVTLPRPCRLIQAVEPPNSDLKLRP